MKGSKSLVLCGSLLVLTAAACTSTTQVGPAVKVTRDSSSVAGCQKVFDVQVPKSVEDRQVTAEAAGIARDKGADTVLLAENSRSGEAYRCGSPNVASKQ